MSASQSGTFNVQEFTDLGAPLVGGRLYTYAYGTTTQKTAYTDHAGTIPHTYTSDGIGGQYIAINSRGELPAPLYLSQGSYDLALKTAAGATVWTRRADPVFDITNDLSGSGGSALMGYLPAGVGAVATNVQAKLRESVSVQDFGASPSASGSTNYAAFVLAESAAAIAGLGLLIPGGNYTLNQNWVIAHSGIRVHAEGKVVLSFTNAGNCVSVDGGASGLYIFDVHFGSPENPIWINGNASATTALFWRSAHHGSAAIKAWNCTIGHRTQFAVCNNFWVTVSNSEAVSNVLVPTTGISCERRGVGEDTADNTWFTPVIEGVKTSTGQGIYLGYTNRNKFIGGTSEGNIIGVFAASTAIGDYIEGLYCEVNTGAAHFDISGTLITLADCQSMTSAPTPTEWIKFRTGATDCRVIGGNHPSITIDAGAVRTQVIGNAHSAGTTVVDSGTNTTIIQGGAAGKFPFGAKFGNGTTYALDFYDVGTFVATMTCGTSGTITLNPSFNTLGYVKVGRMVTVSGLLIVSSVSAPVGTVDIGTIPFSTDAAASSRSAAAIRADVLAAGAITQIMGKISASSNKIRLESYSAGAANLSVAGYIQANTEIQVSLTFISAS
ncbi:hypothetical protein UFOVP92_43 [uncultured Caudovirales phage]|uniref:Uncharacterized protein n=1 Tax=uncultured Caudovirales phage TaxID=2100421 RepID=A0A6J5L1T3_9CAUD|nr:hypothetical protein UFOVP92_43 [uncultured Caudovirales phage]